MTVVSLPESHNRPEIDLLGQDWLHSLSAKKETRPVGRASMWCYFELVNGSTANSEQMNYYMPLSHFQVATDSLVSESSRGYSRE